MTQIQAYPRQFIKQTRQVCFKLAYEGLSPQ